ncbi:hypothetical protein V1264_014319 [Littorina saxatilis]|uniref:tRNA N(3)-methylcytidine methyltransferase n=2 Tax=Littorina saxatilis TaxID=31220 RepID=A0AAN9BS10_9CAEN
MENQREQPPSAEEVGADGQDRKKPQFGTRFLTDPKNVFEHNAWDNVVWDEEQEAEARQKTLEQLEHAAAPEKQEEYEREADQFWDKFYEQHQNRFFKDRHWLFTEFPELYSSKGNTNPDTSNNASASSSTEPQTTAASGNDSQLLHEDRHLACELKASGDGSDSATISGGSHESKADVHLQESKGQSTSVSGSSNSAEERLKNISLHDTDSGSTSETYPGESATFRILEVGCGVGNTVFPVLSTNNDPGLMLYCCDFSSTAVQLVKEHRDYDPKRCHAFVWDITDENSKLPFPPESLDIVIMIFVLSAVHPEKMQQALDRLASCLKPGGQILLRDYGRYDMAQLRFKKGRCLSQNFYVRGDGTRVYFFTQEEFRSMFQKAGLEEVQNLIDRRLQVNRGRQLKMYRVWLQCKYQKPLKATQPDNDSSIGASAS